MGDEQSARFGAIRDLAQQAREAVDNIAQWARDELVSVDNDSPRQAEHLQRIQQAAGTAVQALTQLADTARHARSYQAQAHQRHSGDKPR
ncbi:hypothetical protein [Alicyclobacillus macrosporangiidus]|jgi:hypothetical protein|uniref:Uncharacterized protein n=1 Tax=Alicyclobacillus macrosporangiidus TaxID=392015 RepID=A0A1I7KLM9_9BACL|nr:hypothetical protein [Alicyclobacillus macrosporangiidus]SFU98306.1 hypothetical protein SAMN05421543_1174 [Alicyclobacillus macrosporangiidus]